MCSFKEIFLQNQIAALILARRVILVGGVRSGVTWWSTAHSKLLSHLLSTRRSRQDRRTPALRPRNASRPAGLDLYPCSWTSPCLLYLRLSCLVLWAALRHTIDGFLYLLTHYYNQPVPLPLLLLRIGDSGVLLLLQSAAVANHCMVRDRHPVACVDNCNGLQTYLRMTLFLVSVCSWKKTPEWSLKKLETDNSMGKIEQKKFSNKSRHCFWILIQQLL